MEGDGAANMERDPTRIMIEMMVCTEYIRITGIILSLVTHNVGDKGGAG